MKENKTYNFSIDDILAIKDITEIIKMLKDLSIRFQDYENAAKYRSHEQTLNLLLDFLNDVLSKKIYLMNN